MSASTIQASVIVWASFLGAAPSGFVTEQVGYVAHFVMAGTVCAVGAVALALAMPRVVPPRWGQG